MRSITFRRFIAYSSAVKDTRQQLQQGHIFVLEVTIEVQAQALGMYLIFLQRHFLVIKFWWMLLCIKRPHPPPRRRPRLPHEVRFRFLENTLFWMEKRPCIIVWKIRMPYLRLLAILELASADDVIRGGIYHGRDNH